MSSKYCQEVLVIGAGPSALSIAAALGREGLKVGVLSESDHNKTWPYTYGIWGNEVDELGIEKLLNKRWLNTVSFFGTGSKDVSSEENIPTKHNHDYGLFDKKELQKHLINQCDESLVTWHNGKADKYEVNNIISRVTTKEGSIFECRLIIDASGYKPVFLKVPDEGEIAVQTCYGIVGEFSSPPLDQNQFILMDYRNDHLSREEKQDPPTFLYAMDMGDGKFFLEETSLGLAPPLSIQVLKERLQKRLNYRNIKVSKIDHEENGLFLPMNIPIPDMNQPILGFGGSAGMVHPASGYLVGGLLRVSPKVALAVANAIKHKDKTPSEIAKQGWHALWPKALRRKKALYHFGLEKLMRFKESELRNFFEEFFNLSTEQWYGFLTNSLTLNELVGAMWKMFKKAPLRVKWALVIMKGREFKLLLKFLSPKV